MLDFVAAWFKNSAVILVHMVLCFRGCIDSLEMFKFGSIRCSGGSLKYYGRRLVKKLLPLLTRRLEKTKTQVCFPELPEVYFESGRQFWGCSNTL